MKKNYFLFLLVALIFCKLQTLSGSSSLEANKLRAQENIIECLTETRKQMIYWSEIKYSLFKRYLHALPWEWFSARWESETPLRADALYALHDELGHFLGKLDELPEEEFYTQWMIIQNHSKSLLQAGTPPNHFVKNWTLYTGAVLGLYVAYKTAKINLSKKTLFEVDSPTSLKNHVGRIDQGNNSYLSVYRYSQKKGKQFIEVDKQAATFVKRFLEEHNLKETSNYTIRTPTLGDIQTHFYNEEGTLHAQRWISEHCIKPIKDLYSILFTDSHNKELAILNSDVASFRQQWSTHLNELIQDAYKCPTTQAFVTSIAGTTPLDQLTFNQKRAIHTNLLFYFERNSHADVMHFLQNTLNQLPAIPERQQIAIASIFGRDINHNLNPEEQRAYSALMKWLPGLGKLFENYLETQKEPHSLSGILTRTLSLAGLEKTMQVNALFQEVNTLVETQKLTFAVLATIPILVATYGTYSVGKAVFNRITKRTFIEPLKYDLLAFQLHLNSERHNTTTHLQSKSYFKGMFIYWIDRLKKYTNKLSSKEKVRYSSYMDQLDNKYYSPEQKLQTIECMFKEFTFLQH